MIDYNIISTGSQGNAVVIEHKILIDCGVSFKALAAEYRTLKLVLLTHIHSDHFHPSTLRLLASNRPTLRFACCAWLCKPLVDAGVPVSQIDVLEPGHLYGYGICNVIPHMVKHNVPNCGWKVWLDGRKLFYCTDMNNLNGISAPNYDLYMVEANYDDKDIQAKIAEKKLTGEYIYEKRVLRDHMSVAKINDWLYANMGPNSAYIYMHCHQDKEDDENVLRLLGIGLDEQIQEDTELEDALKMFNAYDTEPEKILLAVAFDATDGSREGYWSTEWNGSTSASEFVHRKNNDLDSTYELLTALGYEMADDEKALQDGTHQLFAVYGSGSKADTPCDKCKAAHPECDKCCKTCDDHCNAFQLCRKEYGE